MLFVNVKFKLLILLAFPAKVPEQSLNLGYPHLDSGWRCYCIIIIVISYIVFIIVSCHLSQATSVFFVYSFLWLMFSWHYFHGMSCGISAL